MKTNFSFSINFNKFATFFFLLSLYGFFLISCKPETSASYSEQSAVSSYNAILQNEMRTTPDFSCPPVKAENFYVPDTPSYLQWYTSEPKDISSQGLKKGGAYYTYLGDIPTSFRYAGPGADNISVRLFNTQMPFLWESLESREFMPCAATHWAVDLKEKTVYYKLNENILWSDGNPCTASDWIFAHKFLSSKQIIDPVKNNYYNKLSATLLNDYCISVKFLGKENLTEYELLDVTNFKPIAEHFYGGEIPENWIEKYNRIAEPTTGPYVLTEYDYNKGLKFSKIKNWWAHSYPHFKGIANFDEIYYRIIIGNKKTAFMKFAIGLFDIIQIDNAAERERAESCSDVHNGFINIWRGYYQPVQGPNGLFFNTKSFPFDNEFVRRGMYYAIDIDGLITTVFADKVNRLHTMGTGQTFGKTEFNNLNIKKPSFNPKKAMELFSEAGYKYINSSGILINEKGKELSFVIIHNNPEMNEIFGFLYAQALKAGVNLEFKYYSGGMTNKISSRDYQAWWGALPSYRIPDNYTLLHSSFANKKTFENFFGYSNPELDRLLERFNESGLTYEEKAVINREIEKIVDEAALMVPSYYKNTIDVMAWKWICFPSWLNMRYQNNLDNPMFGYMWFDAEIEAECKKAKAENKMLEENSYSLSGRYK
ncbi:ABC transporter substrate-binding protein [Treponema pedis]|uniref:ABC transporter substrate-binding protein n=1 Tax=Treponema pedis TaxID=409322 RepID=UPI000408709C|nr:ABC transporter substrate-binding protein [Treponema pedis]